MSSLQLNDSVYQEFPGPNIMQMPKLLAAGRVPLRVHEVLERRVAVRNSPSEVRASWYEHFFDTSDGVAYSTNGKFKIVLDAQPIIGISPSSVLRAGALAIDEDIYNALAGQEFRKDDRKYFGKSLTEKQALKHEGLRLLLRGQENAERIIPAVFQIGKDAYGYTEMMGSYLRNTPTESPEMRAWFVDEVSCRSGLGGGAGLDDYGRLVGVAPETRRAT